MLLSAGGTRLTGREAIKVNSFTLLLTVAAVRIPFGIIL